MKPTTSPTEASVADALDSAFICQENIFAVAILLEDRHTSEAGDQPENRVVAGAGRIIATEARRLKAALEILEEHHSQWLKNSAGKTRRGQVSN